MHKSGWRITTVHAAGEPPRGRRQAEHFGITSQLLEEFDIWARRTSGFTASGVGRDSATRERIGVDNE
jgi:hypothetical protein